MDQIEQYIQCPFCGESICILLDTSVGPARYTEDCQVCCSPIDLHVSFDHEGAPIVRAERE